MESVEPIPGSSNTPGETFSEAQRQKLLTEDRRAVIRVQRLLVAYRNRKVSEGRYYGHYNLANETLGKLLSELNRNPL